MQLLPGTARQMGVTDSFDPRQNIMGGDALSAGAGAAVLQDAGGRPDCDGRAQPLTVCSSDEKVKVIAGYHAGPGGRREVRRHPPVRDHARLRRDGAAAIRAVPEVGRTSAEE